MDRDRRDDRRRRDSRDEKPGRRDNPRSHRDNANQAPRKDHRDRSRSPPRHDKRNDRRRSRSPPRGPTRGGHSNRGRDHRPNCDARGPPRQQPHDVRGHANSGGPRKPGAPEKAMRDAPPPPPPEDEDSEAEMARVMGFQGFRSTKNTKVPGNDKNYGVNKRKKTEYRQYMNRVGGFNRPLSPSRA